MPKVDPKKVEEWLAAGERFMKSPIALPVLNLLASILPKASITPQDLAGMRARLGDAGARKERAKKRAGLS